MGNRIKNYQGRNYKRKRKKDVISKAKRSSVMSRIRSKNTKFEQQFISLLKKRVKRKFQIHYTEVRGKPDIVFVQRKVCVFLDSDFWHGWQYPRWKHLLKNEFWRNKINQNRRRDRNTTAFLRRKGWVVIRLWEHNLKIDAENQIRKIKDIF